MTALATVGLWTVVAAVLAYSAIELHKRKIIKNEFSRKLIHVSHGLIVAVWPLFFGYGLIIAIEIFFLLTIPLMFKYGRFKWLWQVRRKSWGEYFFPIGVIVTILLASSVWVYEAAILYLALADAAAALVGKRYGNRTIYRVFGQRKSLAGSFAFLIVCVAITAWLVLLSPVALGIGYWGIIIWLPVLLTAVEAVGVYGTDNLLIPIISVYLLGLLTA